MSSITADSLQKYINETWPKVSPLVFIKEINEEKLISVTFCGRVWVEGQFTRNLLSVLQDTLNYFERNINTYYYNRAFGHSIPDKKYTRVHTWFRVETQGQYSIVLDYHNKIIMDCWGEEYQETLTALENFLRQYEECHKSSMRNIIRSLPLPIINAILEYW